MQNTTLYLIRHSIKYDIKDIVEKDLQGTVTIESEPQKGFALHVRFGKV